MARDPIDILESIQLTRDPYNYSRVAERIAPAIAEQHTDLGLGIDYRTDASPKHLVRGLVSVKFIAVPALVLVCTIVLRVLSPWTSSLFALGALASISVVMALYRMASEDIRVTAPNPIASFLLVACAGPTIWFLLWLSTFLETPGVAIGMPFLIALAITLWLADDLARHYAAWAAADPRVSASTRDAWRSSWERRWQTGSQATGEASPLNTVLNSYAKRFLFIAIPYIAAVLSLWLVGDDAFGRLLAGSLALLVFAGLLIVAAPDPRKHSPRILMRALSSYLTYCPQSKVPPGVFRSPTGSGNSRYTKFVLTLAAITFAVPTMALYFPVGLITSGPEPWHLAAERTQWVESSPDRVMDNPAPRPTRGQIRRELSSAQRVYLNALQSAAARDSYLDSLRDDASTDSRNEAVAQYITRTPETWLVLAIVGMSTLQPLFVWSLLISLLLSLAVPIALLLLILYTLAGEAVSVFDEAFVGPNATHARRDIEPAWRGYVERLQSSPSLLVRDHLWLGTTKINDYPVLLHRNALHEHAHILGDTGSGKTSRGLAPLVSQLIASAPRKGNYPGHSVVIIDLKGEPYFFNGTKQDAEDAKLPFNWFTNVLGQSTHAFNPFLQSHAKSLSPQQLSEVLLQSLGLEYGEAYGPSHFSRTNRRVLQRAIQMHSDKHGTELKSFRELAHILETGLDDMEREEKRDATDVFAVIESLARYDTINMTQEDVDAGRIKQATLDASIDMTSFLTEPRVGYFYFSSSLETSTVRELSKLVLFSLLTAAVELERTHGPGHQVYVVIDEFQQIIANNLELVLRQARSKKISCILANQSMSDLKSGGIDVIPTVQANTRVRQYFAASDLKQQELIEKSGGDFHEHQVFNSYPIEELALELGRFRPPEDEVVIAGSISRDEVIAMTDDPDSCILHVTRGSGFTQFSGYPILMNTDYHVSKGTFEQLQREPWPKQTDETMVAPLATPPAHEKSADTVYLDRPQDPVQQEAKKRARRYKRES